MHVFRLFKNKNSLTLIFVQTDQRIVFRGSPLEKAKSTQINTSISPEPTSRKDAFVQTIWDTQDVGIQVIFLTVWDLGTIPNYLGYTGYWESGIIPYYWDTHDIGIQVLYPTIWDLGTIPIYLGYTGYWDSVNISQPYVPQRRFQRLTFLNIFC